MDALIAEVAKRHRFVLSPDDPALAVITLMELAGRELETRLAETLAAADLSGRSEAALVQVQTACDRMVRDVAAAMRGQMDAAHAQAREDMAASLASAVEVMHDAVGDVNKARRGAFAAASLSGCIGLGIVLVLTAPVWGAVFNLGG